MTATQLAQRLLDLAADAGHDLPVVVGPDDNLQTVCNAWPVNAVKVASVYKLTDECSPQYHEVVHVY